MSRYTNKKQSLPVEMNAYKAKSLRADMCGGHSRFLRASTNIAFSFSLCLVMIITAFFVRETLMKRFPEGNTKPVMGGAISVVDDRKEAVRELYLHTLKHALTGSLYPMAGRCSPKDCKSTLPYDARMRERGNDWPPTGYTMVGNLRLDNIRWIIEDVVTHKIPGDFLELGVWRGGSCIFARAVLDSLGEQHRKVVLFDMFGDIREMYGPKTEFLSVSRQEVEAAFDLLGFPTGENVKFVEGMFQTSIPKHAKDTFDQVISVLRIDGNFYSSYQDSMYYLYDRVPVGGYVIFDDILSTKSVKQFWKDFQADQGISEKLTPIDDHSAWFQKTKSIKTDWAHYKTDIQ